MPQHPDGRHGQTIAGSGPKLPGKARDTILGGIASQGQPAPVEPQVLQAYQMITGGLSTEETSEGLEVMP